MTNGISSSSPQVHILSTCVLYLSWKKSRNPSKRKEDRCSLLEQEPIAQLVEAGGSESWLNVLMLLNDKKYSCEIIFSSTRNK